MSGLEIENCTVTANGGSSAYGVLGSAKTDFLVKQSNITAAASMENGEAHSVFSSEGKVKSEASVLVPEVPGAVTYQISAVEGQMPLYVNPGDSSESWQLPAEVSVIVTECGTEEESISSVPVTWDTPASGLEKPGYEVVKGSFLLQASRQRLVNPDNIVPEITVISLPPEKMFLISYETFHNGVQGAKIIIPYPYGAESLKLEYSLDNGKTFQLYKSAGTDNLMSAENPWMVKGLFSLYLDLPVRNQAVLLRTIVSGNSLFNGTSAVWTIGEDKETEEAPGKAPGTSDDINDDQGGDRGGQNSNPGFHEQGKPDVPHLEAEAPAAEQNVTEGSELRAAQSEEDVGNHDVVILEQKPAKASGHINVLEKKAYKQFGAEKPDTSRTDTNRSKHLRESMGKRKSLHRHQYRQIKVQKPKPAQKQQSIQRRQEEAIGCYFLQCCLV